MALIATDDRDNCVIEAIKSERVDIAGDLWYRIKWLEFPANATPHWIRASSIYNKKSGDASLHHTQI